MRWLDGITYDNGHELGQTLGDGEGQRGLVCCSPWSCKELDTTERLNNNALFPPGIGHCLSSVYLMKHNFTPFLGSIGCTPTASRSSLI